MVEKCSYFPQTRIFSLVYAASWEKEEKQGEKDDGEPTAVRPRRSSSRPAGKEATLEIAYPPTCCLALNISLTIFELVSSSVK